MIRKCKEKDKESGKPWCLYTKDGAKLLGRHPTKESAEKQEQAIHARAGLKKIMKYLGCFEK